MKKILLAASIATLASCQDVPEVEQTSDANVEYGIKRSSNTVTYVWLDQYPIVGLVQGLGTYATCWYFADATKGVDYDMRELFLKKAKPANKYFINISTLKKKLEDDIHLAKQRGDRARGGELKAIKHQVFGPGGTHDRESIKLLPGGNTHSMKEFGKRFQISSSLDKITWFRKYLAKIPAKPIKGNIVTPIGKKLGNKNLIECPTSRADKKLLRAGYQKDNF